RPASTEHLNARADHHLKQHSGRARAAEHADMHRTCETGLKRADASDAKTSASSP
ncbi:hypothetical protein QYE76_050320, partial [Lolium multiflorum]